MGVGGDLRRTGGVAAHLHRGDRQHHSGRVRDVQHPLHPCHGRRYLAPGRTQDRGEICWVFPSITTGLHERCVPCFYCATPFGMTVRR